MKKQEKTLHNEDIFRVICNFDYRSGGIYLRRHIFRNLSILFRIFVAFVRVFSPSALANNETGGKRLKKRERKEQPPKADTKEKKDI